MDDILVEYQMKQDEEEFWDIESLQNGECIQGSKNSFKEKLMANPFWSNLFFSSSDVGSLAINLHLDDLNNDSGVCGKAAEINVIVNQNNLDDFINIMQKKIRSLFDENCNCEGIGEKIDDENGATKIMPSCPNTDGTPTKKLKNYMEWLFKFSELNKLDSIGYCISTLKIHASQSSNIYLDSIPEYLFFITQLTKLDLKNHSINEIPTALFFLPNLEYLALSNNKIKKVFTEKNISLKEDSKHPSSPTSPTTPSNNDATTTPSPPTDTEVQMSSMVSSSSSSSQNNTMASANTKSFFSQFKNNFSFRKSSPPNQKILQIEMNKNSGLTKTIDIESQQEYDGNDVPPFLFLSFPEILKSKNSFILGSFLKSKLKMINLSFNCLSSLHDMFLKLDNLTSLSIANNNFTSFPKIICNLKSLTYLDLSNNRICCLPESVSNLKSLVILIWDNNTYSSYIRTTSMSLENVPSNLLVLSLSSNNLKSLEDTICLSTLKRLNLNNNSIKILNPQFLKMKELEYLNLGSNYLSTIPDEIWDLSNLKYLDLSYNDLSTIPSSSNTIEKLEYLSFSHNNITSIPKMGKFHHLQQIDLSHNKLQNISNDFFFGANQLKFLNLSNNHLTSLPESLSCLKVLKSLDVSCNLIDSLPSMVGSLVSLECLFVHKNAELKSISSELIKCTKLKSFKLGISTMEMRENCGEMNFFTSFEEDSKPEHFVSILNYIKECPIQILVHNLLKMSDIIEIHQVLVDGGVIEFCIESCMNQLAYLKERREMGSNFGDRDDFLPSLYDTNCLGILNYGLNALANFYRNPATLHKFEANLNAILRLLDSLFLFQFSFANRGKVEESMDGPEIDGIYAKFLVCIYIGIEFLTSLAMNDDIRIIIANYNFFSILENLCSNQNFEISSRARRCISSIGHFPKKLLGGRGVRVLSLDGGGVRCLSSIMVLDELERRLSRPLSYYFDLIVGTSAGGLIAAFMNWKGAKLKDLRAGFRDLVNNLFVPKSFYANTATVMNNRIFLKDIQGSSTVSGVHEKEENEYIMNEIYETSNSTSKSIFSGPWKKMMALLILLYNKSYYETVHFEKLLKSFGDDILLDTSLSDDSTRFAMVSSNTAIFPPEPYLFRNYNVLEKSIFKGTCSREIWEACRATSAAPGYFDPLIIDDLNLVDGAVLYNNPSAIAINEARSIWPNKDIELLISCGGGIAEPKPVNGTLYNFVTTVISGCTETEKTHITISPLMPKDTYYRLQPIGNAFDINLDEKDPQKLDLLEEQTREWILANSHIFDQLANRLVE